MVAEGVAQGFLERFVVRVLERRGDEAGVPKGDVPPAQLGSGVLLAPRIVATCRHVVEEPRIGPIEDRGVLSTVIVRLRGEPVIARVAAVRQRRGIYDDVAFLFLKEPLGRSSDAYPVLLRGVTERTHERLCAMLEREGLPLYSGGFPDEVARRARVTIRGCQLHAGKLVDCYHLNEPHAQGCSGGPVWIASDRAEHGPGVVIGLMFQGARSHDSAGPPLTHVCATDMVLAVGEQLGRKDDRARIAKLRTIALEPTTPARSSWDCVAASCRILKEGPAAFVEALDSELRGRVDGRVEVVRAVAMKVDALGAGTEPALALVDACYKAWSWVLENSPGEGRAARDTARRVISEWLPRRYGEGDEARETSFAREEAPDGCSDLEASTDNATFVEVHVARADDRRLELESRRRGSGGPSEAREIEGRHRVPEPPALRAQKRTPERVTDEIVEGIARKFPTSHDGTRAGMLRLAREHVEFRRERGAGYGPLYLAVVNGQMSREELEHLKQKLPPLRLVTFTGPRKDTEGRILHRLLEIFRDDERE